MKFSIPKPCHESWQNMMPRSQGRHCDSCAKTVVDFTKMNPNEIKAYFRNKTEEKICGRFRENQLHNSTLEISVSKTLKILGLASILFLMPFTSAFAQDTNSIRLSEDSLTHDFDGNLMGDIEVLGFIEEKETEDNLPYPNNIVDDPAIFLAGNKDLFNYIKNKVGEGPFPYEEKIFVSFVIDSTGHCVKPKILRGKNPQLKEKVIQIVLNLPQWQPACHNDKPVAVQYTIPFLFVNKKD